MAAGFKAYYPSTPGNGKTIKLLLIAVVVVIAVVVIMQWYKSLKTAAETTGNILGDQAISDALGIDKNRIAFLRSLGYNLWENGVKTPWYSLWLVRDYDEELFISSINQCNTVTEALALSDFYKEKSGETLADAIRASFSSSDKARVKTDILNNLLK